PATVRCHILVDGYRREAGETVQPSHSAFNAKMLGWRDVLRVVETADRHRDPFGFVIAKAQRRSAGRAKIAMRQRGAGKTRGGPARPCEILPAHRDQGGEWSADRLLASPAMAQMNPLRRCGQRVANGTALAAAGHHRIFRIG